MTSFLDDASVSSPSQCEAFECLRKGAWKYIVKIPEPPSASAGLGIRVHKTIEKYLVHGIPIDLTTEEGEIAIQGIHLWPEPGTVEGIEKGFTTSIGGLPFRGVIDIWEIGRVTDHKTTSDFRWAKSPDDLVTDTQAAVYAKAEFERSGGEFVDLRWIYYRTRKPYKVLPIERRVTRLEIAPTLERVAGVAGQIAALKKTTVNPLDLPPNIAVCEKYGGCRFREYCVDLTVQKKVTAIMSQTTLQELQALANRVNPGQAAPPVAAPALPELPPGWAYVQENGMLVPRPIPATPPQPTIPAAMVPAVAAVPAGFVPVSDEIPRGDVPYAAAKALEAVRNMPDVIVADDAEGPDAREDLHEAIDDTALAIARGLHAWARLVFGGGPVATPAAPKRGRGRPKKDA